MDAAVRYSAVRMRSLLLLEALTAVRMDARTCGLMVPPIITESTVSRSAFGSGATGVNGVKSSLTSPQILHSRVKTPSWSWLGPWPCSRFVVPVRRCYPP